MWYRIVMDYYVVSYSYDLTESIMHLDVAEN